MNGRRWGSLPGAVDGSAAELKGLTDSLSQYFTPCGSRRPRCSLPSDSAVKFDDEHKTEADAPKQRSRPSSSSSDDSDDETQSKKENRINNSPSKNAQLDGLFDSLSNYFSPPSQLRRRPAPGSYAVAMKGLSPNQLGKAVSPAPPAARSRRRSTTSELPLSPTHRKTSKTRQSESKPDDVAVATPAANATKTPPSSQTINNDKECTPETCTSKISRGAERRKRKKPAVKQTPVSEGEASESNDEVFSKKNDSVDCAPLKPITRGNERNRDSKTDNKSTARKRARSSSAEADTSSAPAPKRQRRKSGNEKKGQTTTVAVKRSRLGHNSVAANNILRRAKKKSPIKNKRTMVENSANLSEDGHTDHQPDSSVAENGVSFDEHSDPIEPENQGVQTKEEDECSNFDLVPTGGEPEAKREVAPRPKSLPLKGVQRRRAVTGGRKRRLSTAKPKEELPDLTEEDKQHFAAASKRAEKVSL